MLIKLDKSWNAVKPGDKNPVTLHKGALIPKSMLEAALAAGVVDPGNIPTESEPAKPKKPTRRKASK